MLMQVGGGQSGGGGFLSVTGARGVCLLKEGCEREGGGGLGRVRCN